MSWSKDVRVYERPKAWRKSRRWAVEVLVVHNGGAELLGGMPWPTFYAATREEVIEKAQAFMTPGPPDPGERLTLGGTPTPHEGDKG